MPTEKALVTADYIMYLTQKAAFYVIGLGYGLFYSKIFANSPILIIVTFSIVISYISNRYAGILHRKAYHYQVNTKEAELRQKIELNGFASFINFAIVLILLVPMSLIFINSVRDILEHFFVLVWFYGCYIFFTAGQIGLIIFFLAKWNEATGSRTSALISRYFIFLWSIGAIVMSIFLSAQVLKYENIKLF